MRSRWRISLAPVEVKDGFLWCVSSWEKLWHVIEQNQKLTNMCPLEWWRKCAPSQGLVAKLAFKYFFLQLRLCHENGYFSFLDMLWILCLQTTSASQHQHQHHNININITTSQHNITTSTSTSQHQHHNITTSTSQHHNITTSTSTSQHQHQHQHQQTRLPQQQVKCQSMNHWKPFLNYYCEHFSWIRLIFGWKWNIY